jgi:hypothetical protein
MSSIKPPTSDGKSSTTHSPSNSPKQKEVKILVSKVQCVAYICTGSSNMSNHSSLSPISTIISKRTPITWAHNGLSAVGGKEYIQTICSECGKRMRYNGSIQDNIESGRFTLINQ